MEAIWPYKFLLGDCNWRVHVPQWRGISELWASNEQDEGNAKSRQWRGDVWSQLQSWCPYKDKQQQQPHATCRQRGELACVGSTCLLLFLLMTRKNLHTKSINVVGLRLLLLASFFWLLVCFPLCFLGNSIFLVRWIELHKMKTIRSLSENHKIVICVLVSQQVLI